MPPHLPCGRKTESYLMVLDVRNAELAQASAEKILSDAGGTPLVKECHYGASLGNGSKPGDSVAFVRRWVPSGALRGIQSKLIKLGELRYFGKMGTVGNVDDSLAEAHQTLQEELKAHAAHLEETPWVLSLASAVVVRMGPSAAVHRETKGTVFLILELVQPGRAPIAH